jgi:hypothetical protein
MPIPQYPRPNGRDGSVLARIPDEGTPGFLPIESPDTLCSQRIHSNHENRDQTPS